MIGTVNITFKEKSIHFLWQHILLLVSLYFMTLGIAFCVRSHLGSSVISSLPMSFSIAGTEGKVPGLTIGGYTNIMNILLVICQIIVLRRHFQPIQLLQLVIGYLFGILIDLNMSITSIFTYDTIYQQIFAQLIGCVILAFGIAMEVRCGSVTMPGEGIQVAVSHVSGLPFAKVKIIIDCLLVVLAILSCYIFWGTWLWNIIGPGTLFAMIFVGWMVKFIGHHMSWYNRILGYSPGFRRYIYGLARFLNLKD